MAKRSSTFGKTLGVGVGAIVVVALGIQLVPYGHDHTNPAVVTQVNWDSPKTRELFYRACADCHSNETQWPWYSNIAPISWMVMNDTLEGREHFNISGGTSGREGQGGEGGESESPAERLQNGSMPLPIYLVMHADARLTAEETQLLSTGLETTFGASGGVASTVASLP